MHTYVQFIGEASYATSCIYPQNYFILKLFYPGGKFNL